MASSKRQRNATPYYNDEMPQAVTAQTDSADTHLYGRPAAPSPGSYSRRACSTNSSCSSTRSWSARAKHLFEGGSDQMPLKAPSLQAHSNGVVALRYTRAD
jgi:hypothetical protein